MFQKIVLVVPDIDIFNGKKKTHFCALIFSFLFFFLHVCFVICNVYFYWKASSFLPRKEVMPSQNPSSPNPFSVLFSGVLMSFFMFYQKDTI